MKEMDFRSVVIALTALTIGFASCTKENTDNNAPEGQKAYISLFVKGNAPAEVRSIDPDQAATINDLTVFILGPANEIRSKVYIDVVANDYDPTGTDITKGNVEIPTTTTARHVYVVGNMGSDLTTDSDLFGTAVTTLAQLQTAYLELTASTSTTALWIEGHTITPLEFTGTASDGTSPLATPASIQMHLIPSRVDVYVNNNMIHYGDAGSMLLNNVSFLNSAGWTSPVPYSSNNYTPADNIASLAPYYRSGIGDYPSFPATGVSLLSTLTSAWVPGGSFVPTVATPTQSAEFVEAYNKTFYALPGVNRTEIVTVVATLADGLTKVYFPVHFILTGDAGMVFESGKRYVMTINLNGDATTGGGGGTDPEIPVVNAYVTVVVTAAAWDLKDLPAKNFQ